MFLCVRILSVSLPFSVTHGGTRIMCISVNWNAGHVGQEEIDMRKMGGDGGEINTTGMGIIYFILRLI